MPPSVAGSASKVRQVSATDSALSKKKAASKESSKLPKRRVSSESGRPKTGSTPPRMISDKVDAKQVLKACEALAAYTERRKAAKEKDLSLLPGVGKDSDNTVWIQLTVKDLDTKRKVKPARIPLAHPLLDADASVCLLTKDPQREYKNLLMEKNITAVNRVVGVEKLKGKFRPFDARRQLVRDHDLFLADERIVPMLPKLCGSVFYKDRKFPVPVDLTNKKQLANAIDRAVASTYYLQNKGSCSTVKIGFLHRHSPAELVDNVALALPAIVSRVPGKWANIQNIELKTGKSAALPIWSCRLTDGDGDDVRWSVGNESEHAKRDVVDDEDDDAEVGVDVDVDVGEDDDQGTKKTGTRKTTKPGTVASTVSTAAKSEGKRKSSGIKVPNAKKRARSSQ